MTVLRIIAGIVAPLALFVMAQSGTANAAWKNGTMFNEAKQQCLDAGDYMSTWPCNGSGAQWWRDISPAGANYYQFQTNSGYCIDPGVGSNNGEGPCNGGDYQHWTREAAKNINGQTYWVFRWVHDSRKCLDGGQTGNAIAHTCSNDHTNAYQYWLWN
uniref:Ricin B lectin domain-containing protein n=1 Tax=Streptomyces sp. NBC_00003 TaxID=2903608 RepID=A0AAU2VG78_9ACTN